MALGASAGGLDALESLNDELRDRTDEALHANSFLGSILWSVEQAVVVVDPQLRVTKWSRAATELWGLREDEVEGEHFPVMTAQTRV